MLSMQQQNWTARLLWKLMYRQSSHGGRIRLPYIPRIRTALTSFIIWHAHKGTKIKVTGYKSEWSGEVEITDATFEIEDGNYVAEAQDLTDLLGSDDLIKHQNEFVAFKGLTVEDAGNGSAFMYGWDGSGSEGDDLYFNVSVNGQTYTFTVESYLCDSTTEVYSAVKNLQIGDVIDTEGFLYWYEGVNPHITSVTVK